MSTDEPNIASDAVAAEQLLAKSLGGWKGMLDSGVPSAVFLIAWTVSGKNLKTAIIAALVSALIFAVVRIVQKQSLQQVISGLVGMGIAAIFAWRTGKAEAFFLPGILKNAGYGIAIAISIVAKHPVVGYVIGSLTGDLSGWRQDPVRAKLYRLISWWWVGVFTLRVVIQLPLYLAGRVEILATANIFLGLPLYLAVVWLTYRAVVASNNSGTATN